MNDDDSDDDDDGRPLTAPRRPIPSRGRPQTAPKRHQTAQDDETIRGSQVAPTRPPRSAKKHEKHYIFDFRSRGGISRSPL
eukprot:6548311-Pyramimonas_sp.AAC.1